MIIFSCSPPDDEAIRLAKEWVAMKGFTRDQVRIIRNDRYVAVEEIE